MPRKAIRSNSKRPKRTTGHRGSGPASPANPAIARPNNLQAATLGASRLPSAVPSYLSTRFQSTFSFGFVTDTHLGNRCARLDVLRTAYAVFAARGITTVFHAGNMVDGEKPRVNTHELLAHGIEGQAEYVLNEYPCYPAITTYFVDGDDHEGWWRQREGVEFGRFLQLQAQDGGRSDLIYLGYQEGDVRLPASHGETILKVMHPGGGSAQAWSHESQKIVAAMQPQELPDILLLGHFHKHDFCVPRRVFTVQGGCTCNATYWMRKKRLEAHVGFHVITITRDAYGNVTHFAPEWFPYFDRALKPLRRIAV